MRVLRLSMWQAPDHTPVTTVMREIDLVKSIEETIAEMVASPPEVAIERPNDNAVMEAIFFVTEVFDTQDTEIEDAVGEAMRRLSDRASEERNMAVLYYYNVQALEIMQAHGVLMSRPAPLGADDIEMTLKQIASHPNYKHQKVVTPSHDGVVVEMIDGEIKRTPVTRQQEE